MIWPILAIAWLFNILERGSAAWKRIRELLDSEPDIVGGVAPLPTAASALVIDIGNMTWNGDRQPVLTGIYVKLEPGQMLGIAGPVGSGKSSLLSSLLRFEDLKEGSITYGASLYRMPTSGPGAGNLPWSARRRFCFPAPLRKT